MFKLFNNNTVYKITRVGDGEERDFTSKQKR